MAEHSNGPQVTPVDMARVYPQPGPPGKMPGGGTVFSRAEKLIHQIDISRLAPPIPPVTSESPATIATPMLDVDIDNWEAEGGTYIQ